MNGLRIDVLHKVADPLPPDADEASDEASDEALSSEIRDWWRRGTIERMVSERADRVDRYVEVRYDDDPDLLHLLRLPDTPDNAGRGEFIRWLDRN